MRLILGAESLLGAAGDQEGTATGFINTQRLESCEHRDWHRPPFVIYSGHRKSTLAYASAR